MPWYFAMNRFNYARWLSVHIRDMSNLEEMHLDVFQQFTESGGFTVKKTTQPFSRISLDQAHEQMNASIKGDAGAVGLTENTTALRRWMVAGPEIARMVEDFEKYAGLSDSPIESGRHHDQVKSIQATFGKEVLGLVDVFLDLGNPFEEDSEELYDIHSKDVMSTVTVQSVKDVVHVGKE